MVANAPNIIAGQASASINGKTYLLAGEADYRCSGFTVETLKGQDGVHGAKGMPQTGMMKAKLRDNGQVSLSALTNLSNATVIFQLANGKVVSGVNMWRAGEPPEIATEDATFDIEFEGGDVTEA